MKVIGLTGFAKSGKSTAAEILKSLGGQEVAFAKHLKDVCSVVFNIPRDHFDNQAYKEVLFTDDGDIRPITMDEIDVISILDYFEVDKRFYPSALLAHTNVKMSSPRHVAQYVGTEVLRTIDSDIHINMAFKLAASSSAPFLICSDMRFDNEMEAVQVAKGLSIGISRKKATPENIQNLHASEKEIPALILKSDLHIQNESTIEEFQNAVRNAALKFLEQK